MSDNASQIAFWNGPAAARWVAHREAFRRRLRAITAPLMEFSAARRGESVVDIGCGCGETTFALAEAVGSSSEVLGVDVSEPMLATARSLVESSDSGIKFVQADASRYVFEPRFDLVFSRFGTMFFAEPVAAFSNIKAALRPGGRMAFVCWRALAENPWAMVPLDATRALLPPQPPVDPLAPGPFSLADPDRVEAILDSAGFGDVRTERLDAVMRLGGSLDEAIETALNFGPLARIASELDEKTLAAIHGCLLASLEGFETADGIALPAACWLVAARNQQAAFA